MLIAIISDTHDNQNNILKAVAIMNDRNVEALIHCGDYCSPFVKNWFDKLNNSLKQNFYGVFGNNDGDRVYLRQNLGKICKLIENGNEWILDFEGKKIYASHMPKQDLIQALAHSGKFDYIFSGHTHAIVNEKYENGTTILNPGEACGYLTGKGSFAIVDTNTDKAEILYL